MCRNREEAEADCQFVYGHTNVSKPDYMEDGHYYSGPDDLQWDVDPMTAEDPHDPGVLGIKPGGEPLCVLAEAKRASDALKLKSLGLKPIA